MIARLSGILVAKSLEGAIVEAGGVGYDVRLPLSVFPRLPAVGERVVLHIHTHVREDAIQLFGFTAADEKAMFEMLLGVSGIGPRLAMTLLSGMPATDLVGAIAGGMAERLRAVPGIGRKTAERLVVELRDKVQRLQNGAGAVTLSATLPSAAPGGVEGDLLSALVNLGYARVAAEKAIARVRGAGGAGTLADLLRETLKVLSS